MPASRASNTLRGMVKIGEMAQPYDNWLMKPIPPASTAVNLPTSEPTKAAWTNPTDKPIEDYARR
jgi:glutamate/aspartate transport system substrate-binding protein